MEKIIGLIESKEEKSGMKADGTTPWKRASYKVSGKTLATFDEPTIAKFNTGMKVEVDYEVNENNGKHYNNIKEMKDFAGEVPMQTANQIPAPFEDDRQLKIIRQACLKACAQVLVVIKDSENVKKAITDGKLMDLYLNTTEALVEYVQNGIQVKEKKDETTEDSPMQDY